jgi:hypothetical protein
MVTHDSPGRPRGRQACTTTTATSGRAAHVLDDGAQVGMRIETIEYDAERAVAGLAALMPAFGMQ